MPIRKNLIDWQAAHYDEYHGDDVSLVIHLLSVPFFWIGMLKFLVFLFSPSFFGFLGAALYLGIPVFAQGYGHKRELNPPVPFDDALDFVSRFFVEQTITFPRWIIKKIKARGEGGE